MCQMDTFINHGTIEQFGLEGTWKSHVIQPS